MMTTWSETETAAGRLRLLLADNQLRHLFQSLHMAYHTGGCGSRLPKNGKRSQNKNLGHRIVSDSKYISPVCVCVFMSLWDGNSVPQVLRS